MRVRGTWGALLAVAGTAGLVVLPAGPARAAEEVYSRPASGVFRVQGHGWGHGRGMSQWGAQGAATLGRTADEITSAYYPGTAKAVLVAAPIRIQVREDEGTDTQVLPASGLVATDLASGASTTLPAGPARWRATVDGTGLHLSSLTGSTWTPAMIGSSTTFAGPLRFSGPPRVRLALPDGTSRDYRGAVQAARLSATSLTSVAVMPMEDYLLGVVPKEAVTSWKPAALQAQAVAARSYSAYQRDHAGSRSYDLCDTTACQVFRGSTVYDSSGQGSAQEVDSTTAAVQATAGVVRTYQGAPVFAEFSSSNGGWSTDGGQPYLVARQDDWDGVAPSGVHSWDATLSVAAVEAAFPTVGHLLRLRVTGRDGNGQWGGRVTAVVLEGVDADGAATSVSTTGGGIYGAHTWPASSDGLRSSWWTIVPDVYRGAVAAAPSLVRTSSTTSPALLGSTVVLPRSGSTTLRLSTRNTGNLTWPVAGDVQLGTSDPRGRTSPSRAGTWPAANRASRLVASAPVAPGSAGTFDLELAGGGQAAGVTREAFEPLWYGRSWISGDTTALTVVRTDPAVSRLAALDLAPTPSFSLVNAPTGTRTLVVRLRNLGGTTWRVGAEALQASAPSTLATSAWPSSSRPPALWGNASRPGQSGVQPGQVGEWRVPVSGLRATPGPVGLTLRPIYAGHGYGPSVSVTATVVKAVFTGTVVARHASVSVPSKGTAPTSYDVKNTGNVVWVVHGALRSTVRSGTSPSRASSWLSASRPGPLTSSVTHPGATVVRPGEVARFVVVLAGNGRSPRSTSEAFGMSWDGWRSTALSATLAYRVV